VGRYLVTEWNLENPERHVHLIFIAVSFFLYAATLILLPRLAGSDHTEQTPEVIDS
jgi:hypothetical protein